MPIPCPNTLTLQQFLEGRLSPADEQVVDQHLATCAACETKLQALMPGANPWGQHTPLTGEVAGYTIMAELARGGMGCVYAAHDRQLDREVAIKTLLPGANRERFVTEAKITAQLPHPSIPPVYELGELDDGTPFLAMKLVRGQTLAAMLQARPDPTHELSRYLQIFEQIAHAVGFAHVSQFIHRDLKPLNIMVGAFGEVQVMDWGLAKDGRQRMSEPSTELPASDTLATQTGTIIGTPGYMAPEQARGEVVDERADVFALGAILAAILTGRPAFVGTTARATIEMAAKAELADVLTRLESSGAEGELLALTKRCLAAESANRPANAHVVASEIGAYRAGVEVRLRQVETERAAAVVREAEQRRRRQIMQWAGGLIAAVLVAGMIGTVIGMRRAWKQEEIARYEAKEKGIALREEERQRGLAETNAAAALAARDDEAKQRTKAEKAYLRTSDVLDTMVSEVTGKSLETQKTIAPEQKQFLEEVLTYYQEFAAQQGDDEQTRARTAQAAYRVGLIEFRLDRKELAVVAFERARVEFTALANDYPAAHQYRYNLARSHNNLGVLHKDRGEWQEAEKQFQRGLSIAKRLLQELGMRAEIQASVASSYANLGNVFASRGDFEKAVEQHRQALPIFQQLVTSSKHSDDRANLAKCLNNLGMLLASRQQANEAEEHLRAALLIQQGLVNDVRSKPEHRASLASSHGNLGNLLVGLGRIARAEEQFQQAIAVLAKLVEDYPSVPAYQATLAASHNNLGLLLRQQQQWPAAKEQFRFGLVIIEALAANKVSLPAHKATQAALLMNLGVTHADQEHFQEAEETLQKSLTIREQLTKEWPGNPRYLVDLANSYSNLGSAVLNCGRATDSIVWTNKAIVLLEPISAADPRNGETKLRLRNSYANRAKAYDRLGQHANAVGDWERANQSSAIAEKPMMRAYRALSLLNAGKISESVAELAEVQRLLNRTTKGIYNLAGVYAMAATKIADKKTEYADQAMTLLHQAIEAGYKDHSQLKQNAELAILRDRDDFKKLLADLEAKFPLNK